MSVLGKILAFLNILGVGGFMALASMDYAKRKSWEYVNFRADLLADNPGTGTHGGLPIDADDKDKAGVPLIDKFGADESRWQDDKTLKELFPANPPKMPTQVAEVERVHDLLKQQIEAAGDLRKKNLLLARILMPLAGRSGHPEIYVDREFYLSMKAQLEEDASFEAFKKTLADAFPIAVAAVRFDPNNLAFEKAFQQALMDLPGEDKWKLAEAFLNKLPRSGATFQKAAAVAKKAAEDVEMITKAVDDAKAVRDKARVDAFVARAEAKAEAVAEVRVVKEKKAADLEKALEAAEEALKKAEDAAKLQPNPRDKAAVVFLQTIRTDNEKKKVPEFVEEVVTETLEEVNKDFTDRFEKVYADALTNPNQKDLPAETIRLMRDHHRDAIARVLLGAIEVLESNDTKTWQGQDEKGTMVDLPAYKRFIAVVGVQSAVKAVNEQTLALQDVIGDLNARIAEERTDFYDRHDRTIRSLEDRANEIESLTLRLDEIKKQAAEQADRAKAEIVRVTEYVTDLKKSRDETAARMTQLQTLTDELNKVRIRIRDAIRNNEKNLLRITDLEYEVQYWEAKLAEKEKADKDKKRKKPVAP